MAKSVLVVDDSALMRNLFKEIVERDDELAVIGVAENGRLALQQVLALKPDVVLLDIEMPEMDGIGVLKRMLLLGKQKVIIVSSAILPDSPRADEVRKLGAAEILLKPYGAIGPEDGVLKGDEIIRTIRRVLDMSPMETGD
jgi:two-component system chemotaxis response regulator CheB